MVVECKPDILLVQEIMCPREKAIEAFSPWLKEWSFYAKDAIGF
jgi:hypothetical protein